MTLSPQRQIVLKITGIYAFVGIVWIFLTDELDELFFPDPEIQSEIQHIKGVTYVIVTAIALYFLVYSYLHKMEHIQDQKFIMERKLAEMQKFETVGLVSSQIAHDLRNQIMIMSGMFEFHREKLQEMPQYTNEIKEVENALEHTLELLKQMLNFGKKYSPKKTTFNINQFIINHSTTFSAMLGDNIEFRLELNPELPLIYASSIEWTQILSNLILNAKDSLSEKFSDQTQSQNEKPCVIIRSDLLQPINSKFPITLPEILPNINQTYIYCEVEDNGIGISKEEIQHLFKPYYTTKEEISGTGLGLFSIANIIKENQGQIRVNGESDHGALFQIIWPAITQKTE